MRMTEYLSDRLGGIILQAVFIVMAAVFLRATGTESGVITLLVISWLLAFVCAHTVGFLKCRARLEELENIVDGLEEKYLFAECIPPGRSIYERRLFQLLRRAGRGMTGAVSDARAAGREYREYVESWVHEIKTPITAAGLICRGADPATRRKLSPELAQIEAHVERALFYARAESPEKDFIIRPTLLRGLVEAAVECHRTLLIQCGVRVTVGEDETTPMAEDISGACTSDGGRMDGLEQIVYTDEKWAVFILGQLLQNAARYRGEDPEITLSARQLGQQVQLQVRDNGMGIPPHELSRVFDRGFTGSNGRARGGSTGMGLYLCRKLADCLEMGLQIASEERAGTTITLTFPAKEKSNLSKM